MWPRLPPPPLHLFHCTFFTAPLAAPFTALLFLFFLLHTVKIPQSIPHQPQTYWLPVNTHQMKAVSPSLAARAKRVHNQNKCQVAGAEERWGFALSAKSWWDNAAVCLQKHKHEYSGGNEPVTALHFLSFGININTGAERLQRWKLNHSPHLWLENNGQTFTSGLEAKSVSEAQTQIIKPSLQSFESGSSKHKLML